MGFSQDQIATVALGTRRTASPRRASPVVLILPDRASVELVVPALHARSLRYVIGVTDASRLTDDPGALRAFATTRPYLVRRALRGRRTSRAPGAPPVRIAALAVWAAPLTGLDLEGDARPSLLTLLEKGRRPHVVPLCLHLVTGEPVGTREGVLSVVDAYLGRPERQGLLDELVVASGYARD